MKPPVFHVGGGGAVDTPIMEVQYDLRLYIAGSLPNSVQAQENLRALCEEHLPGRYTLEVIDFLEQPERALQDGVVVTPTLIKAAPGARRMVIGSLADRSTVLRALDLPDVA